MMVTAVASAMLGFFILGQLSGSIHDPMNTGAVDHDTLPAVLMVLLDHRAVFLFLVLPGLAGGLLLLLGARPRALWYAIGLLGVVLQIATLLACFVAFIAPFYQYQEL